MVNNKVVDELLGEQGTWQVTCVASGQQQNGNICTYVHINN